MGKYKTKFLTSFFLVFVASQFVTVDFVYAEKFEDISISDLILGVQFLCDGEVTYIPNSNSNSNSDDLRISSMRTSLDAPVITRTDGRPGQIASDADIEVERYKEDYSIHASVLGRPNYFIQNTTRNLELVNLNITDTFDLNQYYMLELRNMRTLHLNATSTITVYFAQDATVPVANATTVQLVEGTFTNRINYYQDLSYKNPDISTVNNTVVQITISNIVIDGFYVYNYPRNMHFVDARDYTFWLNSHDNIYSQSTSTSDTLTVFDRSMRFDPIISPMTQTMLPQSVTGLNSSELQASLDPSFIYSGDLDMKIYGWETVKELEQALKEQWVKDIPDLNKINDIVDYSLKTAHLSLTFSDKLYALLKESMSSEYANFDDYMHIVESVMTKIMPICYVTNAWDVMEFFDIDFTLHGFFDALKSGVKSVTNAIASTVPKVAEHAPSIIDSVGNAIANVFTPIGQTVDAVTGNFAGATTNIADTAGNMVIGTSGNLVNGVTAVAGSVTDMGTNIFQSLRIPLIFIGGGLIVVGIGAAIFYVIKMQRTTQVASKLL